MQKKKVMERERKGNRNDKKYFSTLLLNYDKNDVIINFNSVNRSENMKVFIVGGTGLLGAAGAKELISRGHSVKSVALPPLPKGADIPQEMELTFDNILKMSDEQLKEMLTGCDGFVFAGGVDERIEFPPPVYDYYYKYNIAPVAKLLKIAKSAGVKKAVILG